jgi:hypothetical protein
MAATANHTPVAVHIPRLKSPDQYKVQYGRQYMGSY